MRSETCGLMYRRMLIVRVVHSQTASENSSIRSRAIYEVERVTLDAIAGGARCGRGEREAPSRYSPRTSVVAPRPRAVPGFDLASCCSLLFQASSRLSYCPLRSVAKLRLHRFSSDRSDHSTPSSTFKPQQYPADPRHPPRSLHTMHHRSSGEPQPWPGRRLLVSFYPQQTCSQQTVWVSRVLGEFGAWSQYRPALPASCSLFKAAVCNFPAPHMTTSPEIMNGHRGFITLKSAIRTGYLPGVFPRPLSGLESETHRGGVGAKSEHLQSACFHAE